MGSKEDKEFFWGFKSNVTFVLLLLGAMVLGNYLYNDYHSFVRDKQNEQRQEINKSEENLKKEYVHDFESGIKLNSVVGDYKIYDYGKYMGNKISCNVQGRGISFSRKQIDEDHEDLMEAFSSESFDLISEDPLIFEGTVLEKRESNSESKRTKIRLTFDGETRLTISIWDDDSDKWKNITSKLYFDKD